MKTAVLMATLASVCVCTCVCVFRQRMLMRVYILYILQPSYVVVNVGECTIETLTLLGWTKARCL